jgi:hypothetical protein
MPEGQFSLPGVQDGELSLDKIASEEQTMPYFFQPFGCRLFKGKPRLTRSWPAKIRRSGLAWRGISGL